MRHNKRTGVGLRCTQSLNGALHSLSSREPSVGSAVLSSASRLLMLSLRRLWDAICCDKIHPNQRSAYDASPGAPQPTTVSTSILIVGFSTNRVSQISARAVVFCSGSLFSSDPHRQRLVHLDPLQGGVDAEPLARRRRHSARSKDQVRRLPLARPLLRLCRLVAPFAEPVAVDRPRRGAGRWLPSGPGLAVRA